MNEQTKLDCRKALRIANELCGFLQRLEHREADNVLGFDAPDHVSQIRTARDHAVDARDVLEEML